ncbi:MAG: outer membrane beta-barrel protein, partial [Candidatus Eisenbacteria bacterium]|nr:outer membrane beta-barrel protein [Candidatus Eisenbacteria bacterium]
RMMMFGGGGGGPRGPGGGGGMFRMGGGGSGVDPSSFFVNQQGGLSTTHSGGTNYAGQWGKKLSVTSSVFVNDTDNDNTQSLSRQFLPPQDSTAFYDQATTSDSRNGNQRFDGRFEWTLDSLNSVIMQPRLYFQNNRTNSFAVGGNTSTLGEVLNAASNDNQSDTRGNNLSNRLTLRHKFARRGRNISADINMGHNERDGDGAQYSLTDYFQGDSTVSDTLNQRSNSLTTTNTLSTRIAYTEPLHPRLQMQLTYSPALTRSESDARALRFDPFSGTYSVPDSALSNSYESRNLVQNGGASLLFTTGPWKLLTTGAYQRTQLRSEQTFPDSRRIEQTFEDVLPSVILTASLQNRRNVRLAYNTSTTAPTINQLQNVLDNSNPLSLSSGNPNLRQTYNHSLQLRISEADPAKSKSRFVFGNLTRTSHPIANSTFIAPNDTTIRGIFLARGTQLTTPENLDHSWNAFLFGVHSRPTKVLKSILSLNGGGSFTRTPTRITAGVNEASTYGIRSGATLSSNISQNLDFSVSYQGTYNITRNTLSESNRGDYYTHTLGFRFNAIAPHGIVVRQELNHNLQSGVPNQFGQDVVLWNTTLGKKLLKGDRGEIRVTATDVLAQERSVNRSVTETYVQDSRDRTLGRYVQAVFTYTWR